MKKILAILFLVTINIASAQYIAPVDYKISLSGNFGEIRQNHFHTGIDIRTDTIIGKPIYAVMEGYVSRISVSPTGYGKAIYINHPNGMMSVYAHLDRFNDTISKYVKNAQYDKESYAIELYPSNSEIRLKQRDLFAYSGDSGSSGAPHLHFEMRDQKTQHPINIMTHKIITGIQDNLPPRFVTLFHIEIDTIKRVPIHSVVGKYILKKNSTEYIIPENPTLKSGKPSYFAMEVTDSKNGTTNKMGLYSVVQKIDGKQNFSFKIDKINFNNTRYINTLIHYELSKAASYEVLRNYVSPNNSLEIYSGVINQGVISLQDTLIHNVEIIITDDNKNSSSLRFKFKHSEPSAKPTVNGTPVNWAKNFTYSKSGITVNIPSKSLYESILFDVTKKAAPVGSFSPLYSIHNGNTPLQKAINISIKPDSVPKGLEEKLCLASISKKGALVYEAGKLNLRKISVNTRTFGDYFVTIDTMPPSIEIQFADEANLKTDSTMSIIIRDNFSGIADWDVYIDGLWTLFEYDAKNSKLTHFFADRRYGSSIRHKLKVNVTDARGNKNSTIKYFYF